MKKAGLLTALVFVCGCSPTQYYLKDKTPTVRFESVAHWGVSASTGGRFRTAFPVFYYSLSNPSREEKNFVVLCRKRGSAPDKIQRIEVTVGGQSDETFIIPTTNETFKYSCEVFEK